MPHFRRRGSFEAYQFPKDGEPMSDGMAFFLKEHRMGYLIDLSPKSYAGGWAVLRQKDPLHMEFLSDAEFWKKYEHL